MKKNRFTSALLALTLITTSASMYGAEEISFKEKAKKQFSASIDRFKRCMKGKCNRWELAKAGRDLIIAITAVATLYGASKGVHYISTKVTNIPQAEQKFQLAAKLGFDFVISDIEVTSVTKGTFVNYKTENGQTPIPRSLTEWQKGGTSSNYYSVPLAEWQKFVKDKLLKLIPN